MEPSIQVIRALATEFFRRLYKPVAVSLAVTLLCLLGISIWLTTFNKLWWILLAVVIILSLLLLFALIVVWIVVKIVSPAQTKEQRQQTKALVDKIQRIAEITATPKAALLFKVAKDSVVPSQQGFIYTVSQDTLSLKRDVAELRNSFKHA